ncbi:MAG: bifunctional tetrahydrofolate synthase/dihydrofolate synthase [Legionellaceae bacterium]|nr:bifunctional tetrahydrofolate synthase/dihydrofolate synthase [Legionellaceae bacterium]
MPNQTDSLSLWLDHFAKKYPNSIHLGLDRIRQVAQKMDLLPVKALVITVAGTNGKGSTVCLLDRIYREAGYRVACYTSPHLLCFNERITVDGNMISDAELISAFQDIEAQRGDVFLSYFEMATLAALSHFKRASPDVMILEVGMGGRLDATNIVDADIAIISSISFDHTKWLGNSLNDIAGEKVGIARAACPVIYGDAHLYPKVVRHLAELGCPLYRQGYDYQWDAATGVFQWLSQEPLCIKPPCSLHPGAVANAVMAVQLVQGRTPVSLEAMQRAVHSARIKGRLQWLEGDPLILLDVAHNEASAALLAESVSRVSITGKVRAVFSALADKDIAKLTQPMLKLVNYWYIGQLYDERAAGIDVLQQSLIRQGACELASFASIEAAFSEAVKASSPGDLIVVYGSFFTVAAVMNSDSMTGECNEVHYG